MGLQTAQPVELRFVPSLRASQPTNQKPRSATSLICMTPGGPAPPTIPISTLTTPERQTADRRRLLKPRSSLHPLLKSAPFYSAVNATAIESLLLALFADWFVDSGSETAPSRATSCVMFFRFHSCDALVCSIEFHLLLQDSYTLL